MALTDAEKQELLNEIKASSNDVSELETVDSLDGIVSLPAMKGEELVNAPVALLRKPAEEAAKTANAAATTANKAASTAEGAAQTANSAAELAASAANEASTAARETNAVKENAYNVVVTHYSLNIFSEILFYRISLYISYLQIFSFGLNTHEISRF